MSKRPAKRRRLAMDASTSLSTSVLDDSAMNASEDRRSEMVTMANAISEAVTNKVMDSLRKSGVFPKDSQISGTCNNIDSGCPSDVQSHNNVNNNNNIHDTVAISIPAQDLCAQVTSTITSYKPLGRPLYTKINIKLQEKIRNKDFIDLSDILVDHQPSEMDLHLAVKNNRVGLTSGKKRKFLSIESWTDAFSIYASVLRKANPSHPTLAEDLAIYIDLIRQIQKDGGDWYFYDTNFRQIMQNDDTLSWSYVDQVLHTRSLNRQKSRLTQLPSKPFHNSASRKTCHKFNGGRPCNGLCGYLHLCWHCHEQHSMQVCPHKKPQMGGQHTKTTDKTKFSKSNALQPSTSKQSN